MNIYSAYLTGSDNRIKKVYVIADTLQDALVRIEAKYAGSRVDSIALETAEMI